MWRAIDSCGRRQRNQEEPLKSPRREAKAKAKAKARVEESPKARGTASNATCAEDWAPRKVVLQ